MLHFQTSALISLVNIDRLVDVGCVAVAPRYRNCIDVGTVQTWEQGCEYDEVHALMRLRRWKQWTEVA